MDPTRLMNMTATVTPRDNAVARDVFGDAILEGGGTVELRCWLSQQQRSEDTANEAIGSEVWALYLEPAAADVVDFTSSVEVDGMTLEFVGNPWPATHPRTGTRTHVEATVRKVA